MSQVDMWTKKWAETSEIPFEYFESIESTNDLAKNSSRREDFIVLTSQQTKGRGRGTNSWSDPGKGQGLLSSWSFNMQSPPQPVATALTGLLLYKCVSQVWPQVDWSLKAPNDLYADNKKVAGLLLESVTSGSDTRLIVGLGFNISGHPEVPNAGHLEMFLKDPVTEDDWSSFLYNWWKSLCGAKLGWLRPQLSHSDTQQLLVALNRNPNLKDKFEAVLPDGSLKLSDRLVPWTQL